MQEPQDFARLLAIPVETIARLEQTLLRHRATAPRSEYDAILGKMLEVCRDYKDHLFDHVALFRKALNGETVDEEDEATIQGVLGHAGVSFLKLHELLLFVPREAIPRELRSLCECLFREAFDIKKISVVLTSIFNAFEYSLDDVMYSLKIDVISDKVPDPSTLSFGNVMELAIIDRDNPLSWVLLAHEFGHYLDHTAKITDAAAEQLVKETVPGESTPEIQQTFKRICSEFVADLAGYYLLGPCSIAPLTNMSLLVGFASDTPIPFDGTHAPATTRIKMLNARAAAKDAMSITPLQPLFTTLEHEEQRKMALLSIEEQRARTDLDQIIQGFFDTVSESILTALGKNGFQRFTATHFARAQVLTAQLAQGLPISTARNLTDEVIAARIQGASMEDKRNYVVHELLKESCVTVAEVLNAAWFHRINTIPTIVRNAFSNSSAEKAFAHVHKLVTDQDECAGSA